nr:MAG TPA: hypothetical protein [Caudoviricetes sp.]
MFVAFTNILFSFLSHFRFIIKTDAVVFTTVASVSHTIFFIHMLLFLYKLYVMIHAPNPAKLKL